MPSIVLTLLHMSTIWYSLFNDSWCLPVYWGNSAWMTRNENGTMEPMQAKKAMNYSNSASLDWLHYFNLFQISTQKYIFIFIQVQNILNVTNNGFVNTLQQRVSMIVFYRNLNCLWGAERQKWSQILLKLTDFTQFFKNLQLPWTCYCSAKWKLTFSKGVNAFLN